MPVTRRCFCLAGLSACAAGALGSRATAQAKLDHAALAERAVRYHVIPSFEYLEATARALALSVSAAGRTPADMKSPANLLLMGGALRMALEAWGGAGHLRFGATEEEGRAFAIAFWPDTRGRTARTLSRMIAEEDPIIDDPDAFARGSVAARGLFAIEHLMFDPGAAPLEGYRARLLEAVASDVARTAAELLERWRSPYSEHLLSAGAPDNPLYRTREEATLELYKAVIGGLEFNADMRLGRPLGAFDRPRPRRAEAWRSGASLDILAFSMQSLEIFYRVAFEPIHGAADVDAIRAAFASVHRDIERAPAPLHEAMSSPRTRVQIEALQQKIDRLRATFAEATGPLIGASVSFNSLDGD